MSIILTAFLRKIFAAIEKDAGTKIKVDLVKQEIYIPASGEKEKFDINPYKKECMLNGYDDIDFLLSKKDRIIEYEKKLAN